jgi:hypothetical protein
MSIRLHIDHLVLDGLPVSPAQGAQVKAAVEAELGRLLSERGVAREFQSGIAVPSVNAGGMHVPRGASAGAIGTQIARSVFSGVRRR